MDPQFILDAAIGPLSGLVIALGLLFLVVKGQWLVPQYVYAKVESRADALDKENSELNKSVMEVSAHNAELKAQMKFLSDELHVLREEVQRLRVQVAQG